MPPPKPDQCPSCQSPARYLEWVGRGWYCVVCTKTLKVQHAQDS